MTIAIIVCAVCLVEAVLYHRQIAMEAESHV